MQRIYLNQLVQLHREPTTNLAFVMNTSKSTFIQVSQMDISFRKDIEYYASPTPLCGNSSQQYNPCFVMAVLSVTPLLDQLETLHEIQLPKVLFNTHSDIRRSMTVNAMRMSTELFGTGSERIYQLAQQRLAAKQTDVVHDLLVYLMHAILDARREYVQELALRAESVAAYLGINPQKVLSIMHNHGDDASAIARSLEHGNAGNLQRKLNVLALVQNQLDLLKPQQQRSHDHESQVIEMVRRVLKMWEVC